MNVVALLAHPDDELACAGTLARWAGEGHNVRLITCHGDTERAAEWDQAVKCLGIDAWWCTFPDDYLCFSRESCLELEPMVARVEPDLILSHRIDDANTSHVPLAQLARTLARKNNVGLWEIDVPIPGGLPTDGAANNCLVGIDGYSGRKTQAVWAYRSQVEKYGEAWRGAIRRRDLVNGWLLNMQRDAGEPRYAEAFRVVKHVVP